VKAGIAAPYARLQGLLQEEAAGQRSRGGVDVFEHL
jgi:hypothetical protein